MNREGGAQWGGSQAVFGIKYLDTQRGMGGCVVMPHIVCINHPSEMGKMR